MVSKTLLKGSTSNDTIPFSFDFVVVVVVHCIIQMLTQYLPAPKTGRICFVKQPITTKRTIFCKSCSINLCLPFFLYICIHAHWNAKRWRKCSITRHKALDIEDTLCNVIFSLPLKVFGKFPCQPLSCVITIIFVHHKIGRIEWNEMWCSFCGSTLFDFTRWAFVWYFTLCLLQLRTFTHFSITVKNTECLLSLEQTKTTTTTKCG